MPLFRHCGGSVLTERGAIVMIPDLQILAEHWEGVAAIHRRNGDQTLQAIYEALAADANAALKEAIDWNRAAAGAPL